MLDFGALPPEINSGLMYTGPGAGPMLAAAAAWDGLAAELGWAASSYAMVISGLTTGPWLGPTAMAMAAAAGPYATWMTETAVQAEQASTQARAAAAAHEAAFAMTVPPPVIAANRALLMALIATNFFGQNTPAIMATEAQYMGMWAQDAAAMYGYAGASQTAATLTPFTAPPQTTNQTGAAEQSGAVAQATGTTSASQPATVNATNPALLTTSSSSSSTPLKGLVDELLNFWTTRPPDPSALTGQQAVTKGFTELAYLGYGSSNSLVSAANTALSMQPPLPLPPAVPAPSANGLGAGLTGFEGLAGPGRAPAAVSAGAGRATPVGALSAPPGWARAAPAMSSAAPPALPGNVTVSTGLAKAPMNAWGGMPPLGTARRGDGFFLPRYGMRITVVPEAPAVG